MEYMECFLTRSITPLSLPGTIFDRVLKNSIEQNTGPAPHSPSCTCMFVEVCASRSLVLCSFARYSTVSLGILWGVLNEYGVWASLLGSLLDYSRSLVCFAGCKSDLVCPLSPVMFFIFITMISTWSHRPENNMASNQKAKFLICGNLGPYLHLRS